MESSRPYALLDRLTARQRECLEMAAGHWTSKEIGRQLDIAPKTVDRHIEEAVRKLGVADRAAAVRLLLAASPTHVLEAHVLARRKVLADGDNPHEERVPMLEGVELGQASGRGSESSHGQAPADVHLDRRAGRPGDPGRHLAAEESGVVGGAAEAGFSGFVAGRAPGGDHQYGDPPWGRIVPVRGWAPEPARRLGWVVVLAAALALAAGSLVGTFDMMSALHRYKQLPTALVPASVPNPLR